MATATAPRAARPLLAGGLALLTALVIAVAILGALSSQNDCSSAPAGPPSSSAKRDVPANFLTLYQQLGEKYRIPWPVLAGIGREECDHGRNPDASCVPQPGASGPGAANLAGAAGPMQIGVGGLRRHRAHRHRSPRQGRHRARRRPARCRPATRPP